MADLGSTKIFGDLTVTGTATVDGVDVGAFKSEFDSHTHPISEVVNLQSSLNDKLNLSGGSLTGELTLNNAPLFLSGANTSSYIKRDGNFLSVSLDSNNDQVGWAFEIWQDGAPSAVGASQVFKVSDSAFEYAGSTVWHADNFTPANKINVSEKGAANGVATLGADSKIPTAQLPAIAITDVHVVADNVARDALTVQEGDVAVVTSTGITYIYDADSATPGWVELKTDSAVDSVNNQTGIVVLDTSHISENTNLYYTAARADGRVQAAINDAGTATTNLWSGSKISSELSGKYSTSGGTLSGDITFNISAINTATKGIIWSGLTDKHSVFAEEYGGGEAVRLVIFNEDNGDSDYTLFRNRAGATTSDILEVRHSYINALKPFRMNSTEVINSAGNISSAARIPALDTAKITTGIFAVARIPDLDAGKITTGILHRDRVRDIRIPDTRGVNDAPQDKVANALTLDFKSNASADNPTVNTGSYTHLMTIAGWNTNEGSGGWPSQISVGQSELAVRTATSATAWGSWNKILSHLDFAGSGIATTASRSDHHHDSTYVNVTGDTMSGGLTFTGGSIDIELPTVGTLTVTTSTTGGSIGASVTTYYVVTAINDKGETTASPEGSVTTGATGTTHSNTISWTAVSGAISYRLYVGSTSGSYTEYHDVYGTSVVHSGGVGTAGSPPSTNGARALVISSGESYIASDVLIRKNEPWLTLASSNQNSNSVEQAAGISIGESGTKGSASFHITYTGDGFAHIGMGTVTNAVPAYEAMKLHYLSPNVTFLGNITMTGTSTVDGVDISAFKSSYDAHNHDSSYVNATGDTMTGGLIINGGNNLQIKGDGLATRTFHAELYEDFGDAVRPIRLRFHQGSRYWYRIESIGGSGFHFKTGDPATDTYTKINSGDLSVNGNATVTGTLSAGNTTVGSYLYGPFGTIARSTDEWLRLNDGTSHTSGVYFSNSIVRTDGELQVGATGTTFRANSSQLTYKGNDIWHSGNYDPNGSQRIITQTTHGFTVGQLLRHNGTAYVLAQANTSTNAEVIGIVSEVVDANNFKLLYQGYITGLSGLTAGQAHFLSDTTAGAFTATEPPLSKPVLLAESTTAAYFNNFRGTEDAYDTHTHAIADITGLQTELDGKASNTHTHNVASLSSGAATSGQVPVADGVGSIAWQDQSGNGSGESVQRTVTQTSHGFVVGDVIRHNGTNFIKSLADTSANAEVYGMVSEVIDLNSFIILSNGYVSGLSGLTAGTSYYLSATTAGALTSTSPAISKPLVLADTTTSGYFFNFRGASGTDEGSGAGGTGVVKEVTQTSHGFALGDLIRHNGTSYVKAQADIGANAEVVGIVTSVADANTFKFSMGGYVEGLSGLTAGKVYFLSGATAGAMTDVEPDISKPVLLSDSATSGIFVNFRGAETGDLASSYPSKGVIATHTGPTTCGNGVWQDIIYDVESRDDLSAYNPASGVFTAPATGWYAVKAVVPMDSLAADSRVLLGVFVNGVEHVIASVSADSAAGPTYVNGMSHFYLTTGDTIIVRILQNDSVSRSTSTSNNHSRLEILHHAVGFGSIDDASTSTDTVWSSQKVVDELTTNNYVEGWIAPTFQNGWVNYGGQWDAAGYYKAPDGTVHLTGLIKSGTTIPGTIFTLPIGYRPRADLHFISISNDALAKLQIMANGDVRAVTANATWLSLNGISFRAA